MSRALGGWQALVDPNAKDKQTLALLDALVDWQKEDKLFENQQLFRTPIVRNGRQATVGYQPDVWLRNVVYCFYLKSAITQETIII